MAVLLLACCGTNKPHDDRCDLGARSGVLRSDRVVRHAVDDADGDRPAQGLLRVVTDPGGVGEFLGKGLAAVASVVDPQIFVIGGGVSKAGDILFKYIEPSYKKCAFGPCKQAKFALATLGNDAGIYGAAALVLK